MNKIPAKIIDIINEAIEYIDQGWYTRGMAWDTFEGASLYIDMICAFIGSVLLLNTLYLGMV